RVLREKRNEVNDFMRIVGLEAFAGAYPHHLSGGMAQRVALARALINHPKVLLLDEPLGALDAFTRMRMQDEVLRLWENRRTTMLLVTHDIDEAIYMNDRAQLLPKAPPLHRPPDQKRGPFFRQRRVVCRRQRLLRPAVRNVPAGAPPQYRGREYPDLSLLAAGPAANPGLQPGDEVHRH